MAALKDAKRLVVKIGSSLLVDSKTGALRKDWLISLAADVAAIRARGTDVILVSSGSIALGRGVLGLPVAALPLEQSQAAAAVGQISSPLPQQPRDNGNPAGFWRDTNRE